jgi:DNA repair exonuclease SbcCD ATPase subunit
MYIKHIHLQNIRSIADFTWECDENAYAGWHVLIGDNGSGKSSVLKAVALGLIGSSESLRLNPNWEEWLRVGETQGKVKLTLSFDKTLDLVSKSGRKIDNPVVELVLKITG